MKKYVDRDKLQEFTTKLVGKLKTMFSSPLVASTVAEMTDESKVYVYVGSESGYTRGNWYFYNGSAWTSGGVYNAIAVETDKTLLVANQAADSKAAGDAIRSVQSDLTTETSARQTADTTLQNNINAEKTRAEAEEARIETLFVTPTQEAIDNWLNEHPEATTTVQDSSLTETKFSEDLKLKTIKDYVTPEMFGAVGNGTADDVEAIEAAIATGKAILLTKRYKISRPINIVNNTRIYGDKIGRRYDQPIDTTCIMSNGVFFHSDTTVAMVQLFDIALWDTTTADSGNKVFDCNLNRCDFRINGYNIHTFSDHLQHCNFDSCFFISTKGSFTSYCSDSSFRNCYISGSTLSENAFLTGLISALTVTGCYFDFWHYVFYPTDTSSNNMVSNNVFDGCYRVFSGKYNYFGVVNNVFMRIYDSSLWSLDKDDWAVFSNGLRNYTRSIGNKVDANYYIHTTLTGSAFPNHNSCSYGNSLTDTTKIKWNPYPNDSTDLLNTRIEEINYKTYDSLQNASLTSGRAERFNHQIVFVNNVCYINHNGTWIQLSN